jgi:ABC-2 type transport system permease protein
MINKYLNTAKTYMDNMGSLSDEELLTSIDKDLSQKTEVKMNNPVKEVSKNEKAEYYFNFMAYSLFAILILGVCSVMIVFNNQDLKRRNLCAPIKMRSMNFQMILGNISFAVIAWFI